MDVKLQTLYKIRCSNCRKYLSRGPVWQLGNGGSICGRCPQAASTGNSSRNMDYENIVRDLGLLFQCSNDGCQEKHLFVDMENHEADCKYRKYKCLFAQTNDVLYRDPDTNSSSNSDSSGSQPKNTTVEPVVKNELGDSIPKFESKPETKSCNWEGEKSKIYLHCQECHPDAIIQNDALIDLKQNNGLNIYMMETLNAFFIIYIQLSKAENVIYFCVKSTDTENTYFYTIILANDEEIKNLPVYTNNNLDYQPHQSINARDFEDIQMVIFSIQNYQIKCENMNCRPGMDITKQEAYLFKFGWHCNDCIRGKIHCKYINKGCTVEEFPAKIETHCSFFCAHRCVCNICKDCMGKPVLQHYIDMHNDVIYLAGKMFTRDVCTNWSIFLVDTGNIMGMLYCKHRLFRNQFELNIDSKIASGRLHLYTCMIEIMNPYGNNRLQKFAKMQPLDDKCLTYSDWKFVIKKAQLLKYVFADKFLVKINVTAKQFQSKTTVEKQRKRRISNSDSD